MIVAVDGKPVRAPARLRRADRGEHGRRATLVLLSFERGDEQTSRSSVRPDRGARQARPVIGVLVAPAADIKLPLDVEIDAGNVGGPSAGLAFALDVLEELGHDVDHGNKVAATGEIELDGSVGAIGGIKQKTIGARGRGIDVFLVPAGDNARRGASATRMASGSSL